MAGANVLHNEYSLILVLKVQFAALFIYRPIPVYIPLFTFQFMFTLRVHACYPARPIKPLVNCIHH